MNGSRDIFWGLTWCDGLAFGKQPVNQYKIIMAVHFEILII